MVSEPTHIVALSGGKDSTALALRLAELEPRAYRYVCTPTGDELPEMAAHWDRLEGLLGQPIERIVGTSLAGLIYQQHALPNWRMRWCTRKLKIEPFEKYVLDHLPCVVYVGIRADETDRDGVAYEELGGGVTRRYPLVEWAWGIRDVQEYLACRGVVIPARTDCGACFFQTLSEWHALWRDYPDRYARYEAWEAFTGHTLRSAQRDSHPAELAGLRAEFEAGYVPKARANMGDRPRMCTVCAR
jgi:3'-phosphoadenosine 5'-phosphosulfate sulfotransferase (PAPS reductase)/FAD synthetase